MSRILSSLLRIGTVAIARRFSASAARATIPLAAALLCGACGGAGGTYDCVDGFVNELRLDAGGKAYVVVGMAGMREEAAGTWKEDGDKVDVLVNGTSTVFTRDGEKLTGGSMAGTCAKR